MKKASLFIFLFACLNAFPQLSDEQQQQANQLEINIKNAISDTAKLRHLTSLTFLIFYSSPEYAEKTIKRIFDISIPHLDDNNNEYYIDKVAFAYNCMGIILMNHGKWNEAIENYEKSIEYRDKINDLVGKTKSLNNIALIKHHTGDYEGAKKSYYNCLEVYKSLNDSSGIAISLNNIGQAETRLGNFQMGIKIINESLDIRTKINDLKGIASSLHNLANIYTQQGNYALAIEQYTKSLQVEEKFNNKEGMAQSLLNIGYIHIQQENYDLAINYFNKANSIAEEINSPDLILTIKSNIANVLFRQDKYEESLAKHNEYLPLAEEMNDRDIISQVYHNIGGIYEKLNKLEKAKQYLYKSLAIKKEIGNKLGESGSYLSLGNIYLKDKNNSKALQYFNKSYQLAKEIGGIEEQSNATDALYTSYKNKGNYKKALEYYETYIVLKDSILNDKNTKAILQQQLKYEYEKQATEDSVKNAHEKKVQEALLIAQKAETKKLELESKQQKQRAYFLYGGLSLTLLFIGFIYNRFRVTRKQKEIIQDQKNRVDEINEELNQTNEEILAQRDAMEEQKTKLEVAHKDIQDSIQYAKRIQEAILPSMGLMQESLKDGFVLYKAKAVVAGDFYWLEKYNDKIYFAAADCTGHGVPGAMVSVMCSNALSRALTEEKQTDTNTLLDKTREIVVNRLAKSGDDIKDGMDISLARIDFDKMELQWSGANNPIYLLKKGSKEIEIIKGNKQPVGYTQNPLPFTAHNIKVEKGDKIYLFTDGYADQFGGSKNKKLGYKTLRDLIVNTSHLNMDDQKNKLDEFFRSWKLNEEQIDDVCVIGIKI